MIFISDLMATVLLFFVTIIAAKETRNRKDPSEKGLSYMLVAIVAYATIRIGAELF